MRTMIANKPPDGGLKSSDGRQTNEMLAASITRTASKQAYYTVRLLVDRDLVDDAFRAYAYFRWFDDRLDENGMERSERLAFTDRQRRLIDLCYRGDQPGQLSEEENMLVELVQGDRNKDSGLRAYIYNMMSVMAFDAARRGRLISQEELTTYSRCLATAVTEALHYFIGERCRPPSGGLRYMAATGAHIAHMLRDTVEDNEAGYYNIPREYVEAHGVDPSDIGSEAYLKWVESRVQLAQSCFKAGNRYLSRVENRRCRLAGFAYMARFEGVLEAIQRDGYHLRREYPERKSLSEGMRMILSTLPLAFERREPGKQNQPLPSR